MALNFQLFDKETNTAQSLSLVDERICKEVLDTPVHEKLYGGGYQTDNAFNWFDSIGFQLATGKTYDEVLAHYEGQPEYWGKEMPVIRKVVEFLRANYNTNSFVTWGSR